MTVRVAQQAAEVLLAGSPRARVAHQTAEVLLTPGIPKARAAQQAIEVLRSTWDAHPIKVAIANPGAESVESGNEPSSWTENSGDWESLISVSGDFPIAGAHEGSRFLYQQGAVADAVLEQSVQLYNVPNTDIDSGNLAADLTAWQAHNYPDDQGQVLADERRGHRWPRTRSTTGPNLPIRRGTVSRPSHAKMLSTMPLTSRT